MPEETRGIHGGAGDLLLMVGTMKGAFLFRSGDGGGSWEVDGPHFPGEEVYAMSLDGRGGDNTLWAAPGNPFFGTTLRRSDDLGASWSEKDARPVKFPEDSELSLKRIWQIRPGRAENPDTMYLGVEPSCLFVSTDGGDSWSPVEGFLNHEHRQYWQPGAGGLCLHTILPDPKSADRILVAFSTGGVYRSDDGGASWRPRNKGVRAEFLPDKHPEFGQCVHKVVHHPEHPERLFLQNHWGLYRSDDWGDEWTDIANGVPSDFGFAMAMHPHDPDTVYIVPLEADQFRCTPEAKLRVYQKAFVELQTTYVEYQRELAQKEAKLTKGILERMAGILQRMGQRDGYTMIVERNEGGVMWVPANLDVTDELIQRYNKGEGRSGGGSERR